jgi:hypothetical protein
MVALVTVEYVLELPQRGGILILESITALVVLDASTMSLHVVILN